MGLDHKELTAQVHNRAAMIVMGRPHDRHHMGGHSVCDHAVVSIMALTWCGDAEWSDAVQLLAVMVRPHTVWHCSG